MRRAPLRETALAVLFFSFATVVFTWPIAARLGDGLADPWDARLNAWILHWNFHQTFHDPLNLFQANIFYPAKYALAFSENLYGAALFGFPLYAVGASTLTVYNVLFLLGMFLSAVSGWALAHYVTGDPLASVMGGLVYAFVPWRITHLPHIQFQWGAFLALLLLFLLRYLDQGRPRDAVLFGICFAWNALCNVHYALFSIFLVGLLLMFEGLIQEGTVYRRRLAGCAVALAAATLVVLPFLIPYAKASALYEMRRGSEEIDVFSGRPIDFLTAGPQNKLYGPLTQRWAQAEGDFFPGLCVLALAVVALVRLRGPGAPERSKGLPRGQRGTRLLDGLLLVGLALWVWSVSVPDAVLGPLKLRDSGRIVVFLTVLLLARLVVAFPRHWGFADLSDFVRRMRIGSRAGLFLSIAVAGVVVALGMHTPYYRFLVQSFGPVFHTIRAPSRGIVLFDLAIGVLAAWGLSVIARCSRLLVAGALLVVGIEYRAFPLEIYPVDPAPAPAYTWLAGVDLRGAVVEWPFNTDAEVDYEFRSTAHWKPLLNGYSGFFPPHYLELAAMHAEKPIRSEVWKKMTDLGASLLVLHPHAFEDEGLRKSSLDALRQGLSDGVLQTPRVFWHDQSRDFVFRMSGSTQSHAEAGQARPLTRDEQARWLAAITLTLHPPFGTIAAPKENETLAAGTWGFGWALDDSGIAKVLVSSEISPATPALISQFFPGVHEAYPNFPNSDKAGFGFAVPKLPPGLHTLTVTLVAKDAGRTVLRRPIVIR